MRFSTLGPLILLALAASPAVAAPNVVILLADDLGWNAVGFHNDADPDRDGFSTPHLDRLCREGVELDRFYVAPMCSPTRAGLMTGRWPIRFGCARAVIPPWRDFGLPPEETTLGETLAERGYARRGVFGKWHLDHLRGRWHPLAQGFTQFRGHYNGAIDYFALTREGERDWHRDAETSPETGYATHLIADAAAAFIREAAAQDAPYLCYVPFNAPHAPFQAPNESVRRFGVEPEGRTPKGRKRTKRETRDTYRAMVWEMDRGIGQILDAIEATGESDDTLVWFLSDNGGVGSLRDLNAPLRGHKLTAYEGGVRVPACVRWPRRIAAGGMCDQRCGYVDILPTLVDAAGGAATELAPADPLDGVSLLPMLTAGKRLPARPWFTYHGQQGEAEEHLAIASGEWKLVVFGPRLRSADDLFDSGRRVELFGIADDPHETTDVAAEHPSVVADLARRLVEHRNLQPADAVPPYAKGRRGFEPPPQWRLQPE